jgi:Lhr-like helicase
MTDQPRQSAALQKRELELRWYQTRLGFWQAIWGTLITGGIAVAIPAAVEAYKIKIEAYKISQEQILKDREITLKDKELQGKLQDMDQQYISQFLKTAVDPDMEMRLRFSQYFSYVSSNQTSREGWEKFRLALAVRLNELKDQVNQKEADVEKLRAKDSLSLDDKTKLHQLQRELTWDYAELGPLGKALQSQ